MWEGHIVPHTVLIGLNYLGVSEFEWTEQLIKFKRMYTLNVCLRIKIEYPLLIMVYIHEEEFILERIRMDLVFNDVLLNLAEKNP